MADQICGGCGGQGQVAVTRQVVMDDGVYEKEQYRWCPDCEGTGRLEGTSQ